ncbi:MAG: hypothetical protein QM736_09395 [Vicinamibacterales bacterium]
MPTHPTRDGAMAPEVDPAREWGVYRCAHGCFHVMLDRVTLTLSEDDFHALQDLMRRACVRFSLQAMAGPVAGRAH